MPLMNEKLETKKAWIEETLAKIRKDLDDLVIQNHRFSGALGVINDLIKESESGEQDVKGHDEPKPEPSEPSEPSTT